jgi:hypothetical protein
MGSETSRPYVRRKAKILPFVPPSFSVTTCREALEVSKTLGARIFWRPGGVVNWMLPELDVAHVLED